MTRASRMVPVSLLLAIGGTVYGLIKRYREVMIVAAFPPVYFIFISLMTVRNDRTLLPAIPFLFVLAAYGLVSLFRWIRTLPARSMRIAAEGVMAALLALCLLLPLTGTVNATQKLLAVDSRETARAWIAGNLPKGSKVAVESYAPFVDPQAYQVQGFLRMIEQTPEWYVANGFDYLVFSQGMFGRFFDRPDLYPAEVTGYEDFFGGFPLLKQFTDGGYEVRIYRVTE